VGQRCSSSRFRSNNFEFCGERKYVTVIHKAIFPERGVRIRVKDVPAVLESIGLVDLIIVGNLGTKKVAAILQNIRNLLK
jgi:hypothetical protein